MSSARPDKPDTRKQILDCAENLMLERSFNAFSYQHIARQLGVKNAAIHYHFPSKTDLGVAVIQRYRRRFLRWAGEQEKLTADPWLKLEWYLDLTTRYYHENQKICPSGVLSAEFNVLPEEMRRETDGFVHELYDWCLRILRDGVEQGYFRFAGSLEDKALTILSALQGALQLARIHHDVLERVKKQIRVDLGAR